jgi:hypothetical protein
MACLLALLPMSTYGSLTRALAAAPLTIAAAQRADAVAPRIDRVAPARFMVQRSAPVVVSGGGFPGAAARRSTDEHEPRTWTGARCRLTPSVLPSIAGRHCAEVLPNTCPTGGTTWNYGGADPTAWHLFANLTVLNATHAVCTPPASPEVLVEGPGTLAVSMDGTTYSNELRIDYVNLISVAIGRRPYVDEPSGELVFRSDYSLVGQKLLVKAGLPSVPGKHWEWASVDGGVDRLLSLNFSGLPPRVHNDMLITVQTESGDTVSVWRRFCRVQPPPSGSHIEPVQLDTTRAALRVGGKPWMGRGYYINGLAGNGSTDEWPHGGLAAAFPRLAEVFKLGDLPIINAGLPYNLGVYPPEKRLALLDAAAAVGLKVMYDLTDTGVNFQRLAPGFGAHLHELEQQITLVRNHSALLG